MPKKVADGDGGAPMAQESREASLSSEMWTTDALKAHVDALRRKMEDLRAFDVRTVQERFDKRVKALVDGINGTVADIFGRDTPRYWQHAVPSLDTLPTVMGARYPIDKVRELYQMGIEDALTKLGILMAGLEQRLEPVGGRDDVAPKAAELAPVSQGRRVCLIHGRDEETAQRTVSLLSRLGCEPFLLHREGEEDMTVMERLKANAPIDFALFRISPEDLSPAQKGEGTEKATAHRNVMFDLGYFLGSLGPRRVIALHRGEQGMPFDYYGVQSIVMDQVDTWELLLAREMKRCGLEIDMNRLV